MFIKYLPYLCLYEAPYYVFLLFAYEYILQVSLIAQGDDEKKIQEKE